MNDGCGTLYICATPIGNLGDITLRTLEMLKSCDYVAAEDTRHTLKLFNHFDIHTRLISCHEHNEGQRSAELIALLEDGKNIALVSDAGMPLISDPGAQLINDCRLAGIPVTVCPGASASVTALVLSGMPSESFVFEGFLPRGNKERAAALAELEGERRTIILYESPHRLKQTLKELLSSFGDRGIAVVREMTKIHEEVIRTSVSGAIEVFDEKEPRGEFVLVLQGQTKQEEARDWNEITVQEHVEYYIKQGLKEMDAIKKAAKDRGLPKNAVYNAVKKKNGGEL